MKVVVVLVAALFSVVLADNCPQDYVAVGTSCYLFPDTKMTWQNAQDYCTSTAPDGTNADLAHVDKCGQLASLWDYILAHEPIVDYWIGGRDDDQEGVYRWEATGDPVLNEVPYWYPGQPDGGRQENCLSLSKTGYFADEDGSLHQKFICQLL
ncbi:C-type lectin LmsL-like [Homarus americanus]|uniref:C-type lectin-like 14 n=1 Tax=Homarus americanus TaxID=6706 RepID=A0A8J5MJX4_HOMAM|nr:C-type lectin LmsL-like [Homarus americanus]KAG7154174.1 C-type lectin-like 14 [Homarus americanus]